MTEEQNPYHASATARTSDMPNRRSIAFIWITFYSIAFLLLLLTMPATSHSNNWSGIAPAFAVLMFGACRLATAGAKYSVTYIYGCGTSLMFALRFISIGRFSLWLQYQAPSTAMLLVIWSAICLVLGASATAIAYLAHHVNEAVD